MKIAIEDLKTINNLVKPISDELYFKLCRYTNMIEWGFSKYIFYYDKELNANIKDFNNKELIELTKKINKQLKY